MTIVQLLKHYLFVLTGCLVCSCAMQLFLVPAQLFSGGISGISIICYYLFGLPIGAQMLVYNLPLFLLAWRLLSRRYVIEAVIGTLMFSFCVDLTAFMGNLAPEVEPLLAAIYGGVFYGLGCGLIFRVNGNGGGMDIVAAIIKKYYSLNIGGVLFAVNCLIMAVAAAIFGAKPAMYTLISMFLSGKVLDWVVAGFDDRKALLIISNQAEQIAEGIINEVGRGVTFIEGEGAFTHQHRRVIFVVAALTQLARLKYITNIYDKEAFMIVLDATEVMGRGFTLPGAKVEAMLREKGIERNRTIIRP